MWVYSTTTATGAHAWQVYATSSSATQATSRTDGVNNLLISHVSSEEHESKYHTPYESFLTRITNYTSATTFTQMDGAGATTSESTSATLRMESLLTVGFTLTQISLYTESPALTSFAIGTTTATRSRDTYRSTTVTSTAASNADTTTTQTTTRSLVTTAAGPTTTSTTESITQTTSTTIAGTVTDTTYATAATAAIVAPVSLVGISEAAINEQAWEVTATTVSAGYPIHIANTFTKRTGTLATSSTALPRASGDDTALFTYLVVGGSVSLTVTTSHTLTSEDTFVPFASVYPATATSTRAITLLSTSTQTAPAGISWTAVTSTVTGASLQNTSPITVEEYTSITHPLTINVNATSTATAPLGMTWATTTERAARPPQTLPISLTSTAAATISATTTATTTQTVDSTITDSSSTAATETSYSTETSTDVCNIPGPQNDTTTQSYIVAGTSYTEHQTVFHNAPSPHTISIEITAVYPTTNTASGSTATTGTSTGFTVTITTGTGTSSNMTTEDGVSFTMPALHAQKTANASVQWTAHQMHPRQGFAHPLSLSSTHALFSAMSISPPATVFFPPAATQDDAAGANAAKLNTLMSASTSGASIYSAAWITSNSRLAWSSGTTATYTTTQQHGTLTATITRTSTAATATGTASFSGVGEQSWYQAQSTTAATQATRVGGVALRSEYGAALYTPAGVRNFTRQFNGTSSSASTLWVQSPDAGAQDGYALPTRTESVWSVTQSETTYSYTGEGLSLTGESVRPVLTASLHPNL